MTLVNRVSAFFLVALASALAGFSLLVYGLIEQTMMQQFHQQMHAAITTLVAGIQQDHQHVKWERSDHTIAIGAESGQEEIRWALFDDAEKKIDGSLNLSEDESNELLQIARFELHQNSDNNPDGEIHTHAERGHHEFLAASRTGANPDSASERKTNEHSRLAVVVMRSNNALDDKLNRIALFVVGMSIGTFLLAATVGRWYCLKALQPVRIMADRARSVTAADFHVRLPVADQQDELSDLATAFNSLLDQLQGAYNRMQRFTGDAAHELRTPLTVLKGQIDVAMRRPRTPEEYQRTLALLREQTVEMHQSVEGLLFLARAAGEAHPPIFEAGEICSWLNRQVERLNTHDRRSNLSIHCESGINLCTSWPLLSQLLHNLIDNSFKYSAPGTRVNVSAVREGNDLVLSVQDHGVGISKEELSSIFEPFFRSNSARRSGVPGVGLGLPIVAKIAEALNGRIEVDSVVNQGSTFRLRIPLQSSQPRIPDSITSRPVDTSGTASISPAEPATGVVQS